MIHFPLVNLEHQRFDGYRHGAGGLQDFAEIDEVKVVEGDAVDGEDVVLDVEIVFQDVAHQPGEVVVEVEVERSVEEGQGQPSPITFTNYWP